MSFYFLIKVKPEGESNANLAKGKRMERLVSEYGLQTPSPRQQPRVKREAEAYASLDMGRRMNYLIHDTKKMVQSPKYGPRVMDPGDPNYKLDQGLFEIKCNGQSSNLINI